MIVSKKQQEDKFIMNHFNIMMILDRNKYQPL
jgi:hypothetical protein